jgi:hypothetical protein
MFLLGCRALGWLAVLFKNALQEKHLKYQGIFENNMLGERRARKELNSSIIAYNNSG